EAGRAQVGQLIALDRLRPDEAGTRKPAACDRLGGDAGDDGRDGVVFLQGDNAHFVFSFVPADSNAWAAFSHEPRAVVKWLAPRWLLCGAKWLIADDSRCRKNAAVAPLEWPGLPTLLG